MSRIIIFTGKGGVGKTSTAAAHAVKAAKEGLRTLIVSTDMAHNLSDIFMKEIKKEPVEVVPKLWALEIDPNYEMERHYGNIQEAFKKLMTFSGKEEEESYEDIVVFPGMEELFSLLKIKEFYDSKQYDLIIVDCAPTGETLSLLKLPELLSWYMEKLFPIEKIALKVLRPISKAAFKVELPKEEAMDDVEKLYVKLQELQGLLRNREECSIRLVTIPEKMIVEETKRNYMYLNLFNFNVDGIYINRVIPEEVENDFFKEWKALQKKYMKEIQATFMYMPIYKIKWYEVDVKGIEGLERIAADSLKDEKVFTVLKTLPSEKYEKTEKGYKLDVYIPLSNKGEFDLYESGTDIIIKIGNFKRNIPMPNVIKKLSLVKAEYKEECLSIYFE